MRSNDIIAFLGVYGGMAFIIFISWRIYGMAIHGKPFLPHISLPQRQQQVPDMPTQMLSQVSEVESVQIGKSYNLKEMEGEEFRHVWDIAVIGMVHTLYTVYHTQENQSIARDRYIQHGWFTSAEYEYLIGPEKEGKQSRPGILRRAGIVVTTQGNGSVAQNILAIDDPVQAIAHLFAWLEERKANAQVSINGTPYFLQGNVEQVEAEKDGSSEEIEEELPY